MYNEPAKSTLAFCQSMTKKYRELLNTGDITDGVKRRPNRQKICVDEEAEANWLALVIKRIEGEEMSWTQAGKGTPWEGRPESLRHLAIRRGIYSPEIFKAKKAQANKLIDAEAKRVNKLARSTRKKLEDVLKDSTINVGQYFSAKGRLNLPHIDNRVRN